MFFFSFHLLGIFLNELEGRIYDFDVKTVNLESFFDFSPRGGGPVFSVSLRAPLKTKGARFPSV